MSVLLPFLMLALVIGALVDIITRADSQVKYLPKLVWILLVVLLPLIGSIVWFAVGHEYAVREDRGSFGDPRRREPQAQTGSARPTRPQKATQSSARYKSTEEQLADLDREIEFHENQARIARLEREIDDRRRAES
jgi:hypothetical protein